LTKDYKWLVFSEFYDIQLIGNINGDAIWVGGESLDRDRATVWL